jgi:GGDEF domain-containing protein
MGDAPELGKINYFKNKSADGDRYIEAVAKAVNSVKRGEDIAFKVKGSEFVIEVENISAADLSSLKTRLQKAVKESPEIQNIFKEQQQYLESELKRNPGSADLKKQLENLGKIRRDIDLTSTPTKAGDTAETVLARTRDEIKQSRAQHSK